MDDLLIRKKILMIFFIFSVFILFVSCEKNTLQPAASGTPSLYFKATFNDVNLNFKDSSINYEAGISNIIANYETEFQISNNIDTLPTYHFKIGNSITNLTYVDIFIYNYRYHSLNLNIDIDSAIVPGKYNFSFTPGFPDRLLSEVCINWYDNNSQLYSSDNIDQNGSSFIINSVKDTIISGNGGNVKLRKASITFSCKISTALGETINVTKGIAEAIF